MIMFAVCGRLSFKNRNARGPARLRCKAHKNSLDAEPGCFLFVPSAPIGTICMEECLLLIDHPAHER